jgi:type II secretory pathway pseudopilin PulG
MTESGLHGSRRVAQPDGYAMAALLVAMSVMAVFLSIALPSWYTMAKREREAELVFRGQQYARAVTLFQRKMAGAYPPNLDILLNQKFLRKKYKDPITGADFQLVPVGDPRALQAGAAAVPGGRAGSAPPQRQGGPPVAAQQPQAGPFSGGGTVPGAGIQGVVSKSTAESMRLYNGRSHYNEWVFVGTSATTAAGAGAGVGGQGPGVPGGPAGIPGRGGQPQPGGRGVPQTGPGGRTGQPPPGGVPPGGRGGFNNPGFPPGGFGGGQQGVPGRGRF